MHEWGWGAQGGARWAVHGARGLQVLRWLLVAGGGAACWRWLLGVVGLEGVGSPARSGEQKPEITGCFLLKGQWTVGTLSTSPCFSVFCFFFVCVEPVLLRFSATASGSPAARAGGTGAHSALRPHHPLVFLVPSSEQFPRPEREHRAPSTAAGCWQLLVVAGAGAGGSSSSSSSWWPGSSYQALWLWPVGRPSGCWVDIVHWLGGAPAA
jgi:hypothetical protein